MVNATADKCCKRCGRTRPTWMFDVQPTAVDGLRGKCKDCSRTLCKTCQYVIVPLKGRECYVCRTGSPTRLGKQRKLQADIELILAEIGVDCYIGVLHKFWLHH